MLIVFLLLHITLPALVFGHWAQRRKWLAELDLALLCLIGYIWHLFSSLGFRLLATPWQLPFWLFSLLHLALLPYLYRRWRLADMRLEDWITWHLFFRWKKQDWRAMLVLLTAMLVPMSLFFRYAIQPFETYYHDEIFHQTIASFVPLGLPLKEFLVYGEGTFHYYYLCEVFAANLSQFTGLTTAAVYFRFLLLHNWLLMVIGIFGLLRYPARKSPWLVVLAIAFFFTIHGVAGPQKMSHFGFRQNTFALALAFLAFASLQQFGRDRKTLRILLPALSCGLLTATKAISLFPLGIVLTFTGLSGLYFRRIGFFKLVLLGLVSLLGVGVVYALLIHNPSDATQPVLLVNPDSYWTKAYDDRIRLYLNWPMDWVQNLVSPEQWPWVRAFWMPVLYDLEFVLLVLVGAAVLVLRPRAVRSEGLLTAAALMLAGYLLKSAFGMLDFETNTGSIVYFMLFGSWCFNLGAVIFFVASMSVRWNKAAIVILGVLWLSSMGYYGAHFHQYYFSPKTPYAASQSELEGIALVKEQTKPTAFVLHNYYRLRGFFTLSALAERRAFVTYIYGGAIFQSPTLYQQRFTEADAFFGGQLSPEQTLSFLDRFQIEAVYWKQEFNPFIDLSFTGFKKQFAAGGVEVWIKPTPPSLTSN